ncbi:sorting nexin 1-like [Iris pallida]|uniref:Sorting nexin 1-like n=1 Tax=Iris pallida TaxID=29817 RepID=A0AAX6EA44_IRIPA|nr:sorting nexin 1-like [Iris pallida]
MESRPTSPIESSPRCKQLCIERKPLPFEEEREGACGAAAKASRKSIHFFFPLFFFPYINAHRLLFTCKKLMRFFKKKSIETFN